MYSRPPAPGFAGPVDSRLAAVRLAIIHPLRMHADLMHMHCVERWGFHVVALEQSGREGLVAVGRTQPELVLATLPGLDMGWLEFIGLLRRQNPATKLMLFINECREYWVHALASLDHHALMIDGAESLDSLGEAIHRVRQGLRFVSAPIRAMQNQLRTDPAAFTKLLSAREKEVLAHIAQSKTNEEIARELGCSMHTAQTHRSELMRKLNRHSTTELIRYGREKGFDSAHPFGLIESRPLPPPPGIPCGHESMKQNPCQATEDHVQAVAARL